MSDENQSQRDFWTDQAAPAWIAQMATMDAAFAPILDEVLGRARLQRGQAVLDIGCGAGTSTQAAARQVGADGQVVGLDISRTLLDVAQDRSKPDTNVAYVLADAQTYAFEDRAFDALISRFGVMFFSDTPAAFANMARALRPGGTVSFATWGAIPANPFFTLPAAVAKATIGAVPKSDPDAPGPFAMREVEVVTKMLAQAGFSHIEAEPIALDLTPMGDARAVAEVMCEIGPAERALSHFEVDAAGRETLISALIAALEPYQTDRGIRIPALINFFTATNPA